MKRLSHLAFQLFELCLKHPEEGLKELAKIRADKVKNSPKVLASAVKELSSFHRNRIKEYIKTLNNRRDNPTLGDLKLGDKVKYSGEYTSIANNEKLTIVEFNEGMVYCIRSSGNYAPMCFPQELTKC